MSGQGGAQTALLINIYDQSLRNNDETITTEATRALGSTCELLGLGRCGSAERVAYNNLALPPNRGAEVVMCLELLQAISDTDR